MINKKTSVEDIKKQLRRTSDYVNDCQIRTRRGEILELSGLDEVVSQLCDYINDLPKDDSVSLKDEMTSLLTALDGLAQKIQTQYGAGEGK